MKRLVTLISTKGKTPEQIHKELQENLKKYQEAAAQGEKDNEAESK